MATAASAKALALASIFIMLVSATITVAETDAADTDYPITITDGLGNEHTFDKKPEHIISIGLGFTEMIIQVGNGSMEKIIITDKYSHDTGKKYDIFKDFIQRCDDGLVKWEGFSIYSTGWPDLKTAIIMAIGNHEFDRDNDVIFLTGGLSYTDTITKELENELGIRHVVRWETIQSYQDVINAAKAVSLICTGTEVDKIKTMENKIDEINLWFAKHEGYSSKKAFYVTYSGNQFKVGNTGSLATAVLQAAHINVVTIDKDKSSTYAPDGGITKVIMDYGKDTAIFADENSIINNEKNLSLLREQVGDDVKIYTMKYLWNNYSIESMNGYWSAACTMYHDYDEKFFNGDIGDPVDYSGKEDFTAFAIAGVLSVLCIIAVTYYLGKE